MEMARFLQKDSIATQLIRIVFALYCIVAIIVTLTQIVLEYQHTKSQINDEIIINHKIFEPLLGIGLWNLDQEQLQQTINGMLAVPIITGVKIEQNNDFIKAVGIIKNSQEQTVAYDQQGVLLETHKIIKNSEIFEFNFPINYLFRDKFRQVGDITIYSDSSTIIDRVGMGFILLVINSILKTVALWVLFFYVSKRILLKPLNKLLHIIEAVDFENLNKNKINLSTHKHNELTIIADSFSIMLEKLYQAKSEVLEFNIKLESKIKERTTDLATARDEAVQANSVKSNFMSMISHELRTPLNAIIGCSQILMLNKSLQEKEHTLAQHTYDAGHHLMMLVEDIMDIAILNRHELKIELETCDLNSICEKSIAMLTPLIKDKNIKIDYQKTTKQVIANSGRLQQVIINLLTNAVKYNVENGHVYVFVEEDNQTLKIIIKDTGVGIKESELQDIFTPLSRLEYAKTNGIDGFGLGLYIVKNLVEKMNGKIDIKTQEGVGSQFIITLTKG